MISKGLEGVAYSLFEDTNWALPVQGMKMCHFKKLFPVTIGFSITSYVVCVCRSPGLTDDA
jgi:hypothetical protein